MIGARFYPPSPVSGWVLRGGFVLITYLLVAVGPVQAGFTLGFNNITNNNVANAAAGEAQLSVEVNAFGNQVDFIFRNVGPAASSITDVYFDDGPPNTLLSIASVINGPGVSFSQGASPGNLPGGNNASPPFQTTVGFSADSNPPVQPNGVNPGEEVTIRFNLVSGKSFADVQNAITQGGASGLRVGIHVQGFAGGGSESFVNDGPQAVPAPSGIVLALSGLVPLAFVGLRRLRRPQATAA